MKKSSQPEWTEALETGIRVIDEQHQLLHRLALELLAELNQATATAPLLPLVHEFVSSTEDHFTSEEELLLEYSYPGLDKQMKEHQQALRKLHNFVGRFQVGDLKAAAGLAQFIEFSLLSHMRGPDRAYSEYLVSRGAF
jgi:hemerythrin-like metal-binding protein